MCGPFGGGGLWLSSWLGCDGFETWTFRQREKTRRRVVDGFANARDLPEILWDLGVRFSVLCFVELTTLDEEPNHVVDVALAANSEVREVIEEEAEDRLAIIAILDGIEHVGVPHLVDFACWHERTTVGAGQEEESLVENFDLVDFLARPTLAFGRMHEFEFDALEVEGCDPGAQLIFVDHGLQRSPAAGWRCW